MKLSLYYFYFLAYSCLATTCMEKKIKPKVEHNQMNRKKDSDKEDLNTNEIDDGNLPPLYKSVLCGDLKETRRLLELGVDPNVIYKGNYPIEVAVRKRNKAMVSLLFLYGAKIIFQEDGRSNILDYVRYEKDDASKKIYDILVSNLPPDEAARLDIEWQKDINEVNNRSTLLLQAVRKNDLEKARKLLKLGANPNIANVSNNPLNVAVLSEKKAMVSLLLSCGAEVIFDEYGNSSVFNSLRVKNNQEILDVVLCHFADIDKKDSVGLSPIHWACRDGHLNVVEYILKEHPSLVHNTDNPYKFTPLHWASRRGFKEIVELLIAKGASKTAKSKSGFTPLMLAIANKHEALEGILSPDGFSRHSKLVDKDWQCSICIEGVQDSRDKIFPVIPLDCGHKFHFRCITQNVLSQHQNHRTINCPNCRNSLSDDMTKKIVSHATSPTMSAFSTLNAVRQKDVSILKSLLEKGGNPNESSIASSALEEAVCQSNYEMVSLLLDYGADPTYQDPGTNNTPLHHAADNMLHKGSRHISQDVCNKIFISLIKQGAIVNSKNVKCETPRDCVCTCEDPLFVLTEAGGIRSGSFEDIKPAFGLSGSAIKEKILFGRELEPRGYHAKL